MTQDYNVMLADETAVMRDKVRRGMLPLVARNPALDRATKAYALAQATLYDDKRAQLVEQGRSPNTLPIPYRNNALLDRCADLVLYEELTWSHADKMSIVDYPIMSEDQEALRNEKYRPNSDIQYGDRRFAGRRKTHFTDDYGAPQVRSGRVIDTHDPSIDAVGDYMDLYHALAGAGLTDKQRQAIDLVCFEALSQEDARAVMGVSKATMSEHTSVALRKLRDYMTKD